MSEEAARDDAEHSPDDAARRMDAVARDVLPALMARLSSSRLGELEVHADGWRVRLRRAPQRGAAAAGAASGSAGAASAEDGPTAARSPGVGYFTPGPKLQVGQVVARGDRLGAVDVLGIEQEVTAPQDGVIGRIHVEAGQAVEYGEDLASISAESALPDEIATVVMAGPDDSDPGPVAD